MESEINSRNNYLHMDYIHSYFVILAKYYLNVILESVRNIQVSPD